MLIVAEFWLGSWEKSRLRSFECFERRRGRERKERNENRAIPSRKHVGATHPENWSTRSESGIIYIGAPPQLLSAPQEA